MARTEGFRVHPSSFEEAVKVALNAEFNFRSTRPVWMSSQTPSSGPEPMDLSHVETDDAELQALERQKSIRRCFICGDSRHLRASCLVRETRKAPSHNPGERKAQSSPRGNGQA